MTIGDALRESGLETLDGELLAAHAFGRNRTWIVAHMNNSVDLSALAAFKTLADRRSRGEPIAYILGEKEFFGRMFRVTPNTLIPRPATEELVRSAFDILSGNAIDTVRIIDNEIVAWSHLTGKTDDVKLVIDVGTGSGCIAVTLACERPDLHIIATDISDNALVTAQENAMAHQVSDRIIFKRGNGLRAAEPIAEPFLLVSNPPYIPDGMMLDRDVQNFEPSSALFAGGNGTDILHPLIVEALKHPLCRGFIVECREEQIRLLPPSATSSAA